METGQFCFTWNKIDLSLNVLNVSNFYQKEVLTLYVPDEPAGSCLLSRNPPAHTVYPIQNPDTDAPHTGKKEVSC